MDYQQSWQRSSGQVESRLDFVRSVYLWLMGGFGVATLGALSAPFIAAALVPVAGRFLVWVLFGAQFGSLLFANSVRRQKPLNRLAYGLFTFVSGVIAGIIALVIAQGSGYMPVFLAFGLTGVVFLTLTVTAFTSKKDFSFLRNFVIVGITVMFFGSLAVIACSAKLLWDTSAMLRTDDLGDPVGFALSLFVSLYNIYISLMNLLGGRRR